ncbi:hypothetical protein [Phenylobacterium sp.]|jgi:hypothetical protein|uniref:phosphoribosyltransferase-like protein n=1 Tax=Phenylobacterium sp. TaxID=1871053 RepID=UPI0037C58ECD
MAFDRRANLEAMVMKETSERIASLIANYREGEVPAPDAAHVQRWIDQFPSAVREPLLAEVAHILEKTYIRKSTVKRFLKGVISHQDFVGNDPTSFWRGVQFLKLQQVGNSQREMLSLLDVALKETYDLSIDDCGADPHSFVYVDDAVFSGGRVKSDIQRWIETEAPNQAKVAVVVMAIHSLGEYFAGGDIKRAAAAKDKVIAVEWRRSMTIEDRKYYMSTSDVLRPESIPVEAQAYVASLGAEPVLRTGSNKGSLGLFSSAESRTLVEQEFLKAGVQVRERCKNLPAQMRPLGSTLMKTTGFGSMFVTYRNCANNTPLVLWAGDPWYPLFPRRTN